MNGNMRENGELGHWLLNLGLYYSIWWLETGSLGFDIDTEQLAG